MKMYLCVYNVTMILIFCLEHIFLICIMNLTGSHHFGNLKETLLPTPSVGLDTVISVTCESETLCK